MISRKIVLLGLSLILRHFIAAEPTATIPPTPEYRIVETIASYRGTEKMDYLAFPAIVPSGENEIMLSYKRGTDHGWDPGSQLEIVRFDLETGKPIQDPIRLGIPDAIMEMGEWVRFPDRTLRTYIDAQILDEEGKHFRMGLQQSDLTSENWAIENEILAS